MRKSAGASVANRKVGSMLCEGRSNRQPKKKEGEYKRKERRIGSLTQANERERERDWRKETRKTNERRPKGCSRGFDLGVCVCVVPRLFGASE